MKQKARLRDAWPLFFVAIAYISAVWTCAILTEDLKPKETLSENQ